MAKTQTQESNNTSSSWTQTAAQSAHQGIDQSAKRLDRIEQYIREQSSNSKNKLVQGQEQLQASVEEGVGQLRESTAKNPLLSVAIAFAAGALTGAILKK